MTTNETLTRSKGYEPGERVTAPAAHSASAGREVVTLVTVEAVEYKRSGPGYFARCRRDDGKEFITALGLILKTEV